MEIPLLFKTTSFHLIISKSVGNPVLPFLFFSKRTGRLPLSFFPSLSLSLFLSHLVPYLQATKNNEHNGSSPTTMLAEAFLPPSSQPLSPSCLLNPYPEAGQNEVV